MDRHIKQNLTGQSHSVTTQHPIENFSLIKHKLDFAYFHHHYKLFND